ncbi:predicted protein [Nematostella vectensis]|uniref:Uncharacterized protein n=1 Tax=Nematostella vectensis TaxID=45351 RepID=A7S199_NEMVE|nr:predicted protein [Nematostella vectensis]|eukprot:XP_001634660.1 predicted protein [Nematostella vectensis]
MGAFGIYQMCLGTVMSNQKALVTWMLYFLLVWQTSCHLSDNGLEWLLQFLSRFLNVLGMQSSCKLQVASVFPGTLYLMRKYLRLDRDAFQRYVVCPKCTKLYKPEQCTIIVNGNQVARRCTNAVRHRRQMRECGHQLVKKVVLTNNTQFRAALLWASSDIPASRKLCGFVGHSAKLGCSRCFKSFPGGFGEKRDYSGFDRENWNIRTNVEQRRRVRQLSRARSTAEQRKLKSQLVVRYTKLLDLFLCN